uniref:trypsin n=1 Tax=Knipowitschia caucasica TaxID=637954 RepID=A0AAV2KXP5_KNICA
MHLQQFTRVLLCVFSLLQTVTGGAIVNGHTVSDELMQYMVSLQNETNQHLCGGALVSDKFVLTAAHCKKDKLVRAVLGTHDLEKAATLGQTIDIDLEFDHPLFETPGKGDDLMLIKLKKKVVLGRRVKIIQLPTANLNVQPHTWCKVAGWGATNVGLRSEQCNLCWRTHHGKWILPGRLWWTPCVR